MSDTAKPELALRVHKRKAPSDYILTPKQRAFCAEFMVDLNGTQAAIRAGYSLRTANEQAARMLAKASVQAEVQRLQRERSSVEVDADFVVQTLVINVQRSMQAVPVRDGDGNAIGEYRYDGNVANKALELLGRHLGMFVEKQQIEISRPTIDFAQILTELESRRNVVDAETIERIANGDG